jgi:hypothetical protein
VCIGALIIFGTHIIIDYSKITIEKKYPRTNKFLIYISDQVAHLIIILLVTKFIGIVNLGLPWDWVQIYLNGDLITFLIILHLATYFWDVTRWTYINSKKPTPFKRDYKMMVRNGIIVFIAFGVYWLFKL